MTKAELDSLIQKLGFVDLGDATSYMNEYLDEEAVFCVVPASKELEKQHSSSSRKSLCKAN